MPQVHHYILTRFNLSLWKKDKSGKKIGDEEWLERRMELFERYCLPSVTAQTEQNFIWILLLDANTPETILQRLDRHKLACPQIRLIKVKSELGRYFARVFQDVVQECLLKYGANENDTCITTYLDNDDCIERGFIEDVQKRCSALTPYNIAHKGNGMFLSYDYGLQLYSDMDNVTTRIRYPNNHFLSYVEKVGNLKERHVKTCYGYGSHFFLEKKGLADVIHVKDSSRPMWIEVIHKENVDNDVKMTLHTRFISEPTLLKRYFSINVTITSKQRVALIARIAKQICRRLRNKLTHIT